MAHRIEGGIVTSGGGPRSRNEGSGPPSRSEGGRMSVCYQTEYCLGRRGRVCRTYSGIQALIAITFDLALGLIFGLIGLGWRLVRCLFDLALGVIFGLIGLGWRLVRCLTV